MWQKIEGCIQVHCTSESPCLSSLFDVRNRANASLLVTAASSSWSETHVTQSSLNYAPHLSDHNRCLEPSPLSSELFTAVMTTYVVSPSPLAAVLIPHHRNDSPMMPRPWLTRIPPSLRVHRSTEPSLFTPQSTKEISWIIQSLAGTSNTIFRMDPPLILHEVVTGVRNTKEPIR